MKKFFGWSLVLMLAASVSMAAEKTKSSSKKSAPKTSAASQGSWVIQVAGDVNILGTDTTVNGPTTFHGVGCGVELSVGFAVDPNLTLGLFTGIHAFDIQDPSSMGLDGGSYSYSPLELFIQYNLPGSINPYVILGAGLANTQASMVADIFSDEFTMSISQTTFAISMGAGISFEIADKVDFFLQGRVDVVPVTSDFKNFLWGDGIFIPLQAGLSFNTL